MDAVPITAHHPKPPPRIVVTAAAAGERQQIVRAARRRPCGVVEGVEVNCRPPGEFLNLTFPQLNPGNPGDRIDRVVERTAGRLEGASMTASGSPT